MTVDKNYFPGFARRAVAFSIDDGNLEYDPIFIDIVKPRGIKGTFNLTSPKLDRLSPEGYRSLYSGFEIANHCKYHPVTIAPDDPRTPSDQPFNIDNADESCIYRHPETDGLWRLKRHTFWCLGAFCEDYVRFADEGRAELEAVFGKGSIKGFVWPHGCCYDDRILEHLQNEGYLYTRYTAHRDGNYSMPSDRMRIGMHARSKNLLEATKDFLSAPDDGQLKMMIFGTHAIDYERDGKWAELAEASDLLGSDPSSVWSASVSDIFEYEDAVKSLVINSRKVENPSDKHVFIKIDGEPIMLKPHSIIEF